MSLGTPRDGWAPINRNSVAQFWRTRWRWFTRSDGGKLGTVRREDFQPKPLSFKRGVNAIATALHRQQSR